MKSVIRWTALLLVLCSADASARGPEEVRGPQPRRGTVIFDGVEFAPGELELPGHALTWVVTKEDAENGTIHVFTSRDVAGAFMNRLMDKEFGKDRGRDLHLATAASCSPWPYEYSYFNKSPGCGGSGHLYMYPGEEYAELDSIAWNNSISCVKAACLNAYTTLYACRNFQTTKSSGCEDPDVLWVFPGAIISDLNTTMPESFNNRTSSIRFCAYYPNCTYF